MGVSLVLEDLMIVEIVLGGKNIIVATRIQGNVSVFCERTPLVFV